MLFDATSVCRAAFCRSLGPGAGEALPPAALYAVLVNSGMAAASAGAGAIALRAGTLCLCAGGLQLTPAENCRALCIGFAGTAARQAAAGLAAPLAVPAALCPQAVQALLALAAAEEKGTAGAPLCFRVLCTLNSLDQAAAVPAGPSQLVAQAVLAIHSHYSELYGVEELSAQLGVSKSHLVRVFFGRDGHGPGPLSDAGAAAGGQTAVGAPHLPAGAGGQPVRLFGRKLFLPRVPPQHGPHPRGVAQSQPRRLRHPGRGRRAGARAVRMIAHKRCTFGAWAQAGSSQPGANVL